MKDKKEKGDMTIPNFVWQRKQKDAEYKHLLRFFKSKPMILCDCGLYIEDNDGFRFFFRNSRNEVEERNALWEDRGGLSTKAFMTSVVAAELQKKGDAQ